MEQGTIIAGKHKYSDIYALIMLCQVGFNKYKFISLTTANRWNDENLTEESAVEYLNDNFGEWVDVTFTATPSLREIKNLIDEGIHDLMKTPKV